MTVAIHQPHFLPWLGYLDRVRRADAFVLLDHVQFERQNYQNRVQIKTGQGPRWLTVPVLQDGRAERVADKLIDNGRDGRQRWGRKAFLTLRYSYEGAPFFRLYAPALEEILSARWQRLVDLDRRLLEFLMEALSIRKPVIMSSRLRVTGRKSELALEVCRALGADAFLGGMGASRGYLDVAAFREAGVRVLWQDFRHPRYPQRPRPETFIAGLSALDLLFNCGPESVHLLEGGSPCGLGEARLRPAA